jgi:hypothetical protein
VREKRIAAKRLSEVQDKMLLAQNQIAEVESRYAKSQQALVCSHILAHMLNAHYTRAATALDFHYPPPNVQESVTLELTGKQDEIMNLKLELEEAQERCRPPSSSPSITNRKISFF